MVLEREKLVEGAIRWVQEKLHDRSYAYLCYLFLEDAYELGNGIVLDGRGRTAKEAADTYLAQEHRLDEPERGAYVFYDCLGTIDGEQRNWGHVGLSLGEGSVIHAWDEVRIDDYLRIEQLEPAPGWEKPKYRGWTPPEVILRSITLASESSG